MKVKSAFLVAVAVCSFGMVALSNNFAIAAVNCPSGTIHAGESKPTYAECNIDSSATTDDLLGTVKNVINVILGVLGVVAVVVIILGGFTFITSQGDAGKVMKGRNTILWGVVGLVVALLAFAIVNFVLTNVVGNANTPPASTNEGDNNIQINPGEGAPGNNIR